MEISELIKKVRRVEIKARGLSREIFSGQYHSAFKGRGMLFSEVREYQFGDDIRNIEWNVTARFGHPFVKVFEEERELSVMLLVDVSGSSNYGSNQLLKKEVMTEIAAVIAFSAITNNDKVGMILFSSEVELFIPPRKGKTHVLRIIRDLLEYQPLYKGTNLTLPFKFLTSAIKKRCTAFVISDFRGTGFTDALKIASRKHDVIALKLKDPLENEMPKAGLIQFQDNETGETRLIDLGNSKVREQFKKIQAEKDQQIYQLFKKNGVDFTEIMAGNSYVKPLNQLFRSRETRRSR